MKTENEKGSYTIEACISLFAFIMAIYIVYLQINTLIVENVLQKAVNSAAIEISSYSYILDRLDLIPPKRDDGELSDLQNIYDKGNAAAVAVKEFEFDDISEFVNKFFENPEGVSSSAENMGASLGSFIGAISGTDWGTEISELGSVVVSETARDFVSLGLSSFYNGRIKDGAFLPLSYKGFCELYNIEGDISYEVDYLPDNNNNTVFVSISCEINSPIKFAGFDKRNIVKTAYSPLWVK